MFKEMCTPNGLGLSESEWQALQNTELDVEQLERGN